MADVDSDASFGDTVQHNGNSNKAGFRREDSSFTGPDPAGFQWRDKKKFNPGLEQP